MEAPNVPRRGRGRGRLCSRSPERSSISSRDERIAVSLPSSSASTGMFPSPPESSVESDSPSSSSSSLVQTTTSSDSGAARGAHRGFRHYEEEDDPDFVKSRAAGAVKKGDVGQKLELCANYYILKTLKAWTLFHYDVSFTPEEDNVRVRRKIVREIMVERKIGHMFDGIQLFSSNRVDDEAEGVLCLEVPYTFTHKATNETESRIYQVTIRYIKNVPTGSPVYVQLYNLLIRKCMYSLNLEMMGRNFFDPEAKIPIPKHRLILWPGFITSIRNHENDLLLCVEVTHKVIRTDSVLEVIKGIQERCKKFGGNWKDAVKKELMNTIVMTKYNRKTYHVDDVFFDISPKNTFADRDGNPVSYVDYYRNRYSEEIRDLDQPILVSNPKKRDLHGKGQEGEIRPIHLIPEFCQSTGLTDDMRANFQVMKDLAMHLHQGPKERMQTIAKFMTRLLNKPEVKEELASWQMSFQEKPVSLDGRILPKQSMTFANGTFPVDDKGDFTVAFRSQQMLSAVDLKDWMILVPERDSDGVDNLVRTMSKVAGPLTMRISNPKQVLRVADGRTESYLRKLGEALRDASLQMLFVILPNNKLELYSAVKKKLAVDVGIPSQCFLAKNVKSKGLMSIATKVVIQMNAKLGGEPWSIKLPLGNSMFVGFDVYHGAKGSKGGSIGAIVSTFSQNFARYFSTTSSFKTTSELSKNMRTDIAKCVKAYSEHNQGKLPEQIFMYRDGVGSGQLKEVYSVELEEIRQGLAEFYKNENREPPKLTYIVVTKKINTRLLQVKQIGLDNPPPGTIADDVITLPERYDFYLISCAARQGTVSPCSYNVLQDDSGMSPNKIQLMTYKMCHMYFNWSGTIAVPAPCQYAHKLAFLSGMAYGGHANPKLSRLLHFL